MNEAELVKFYKLCEIEARRKGYSEDVCSDFKSYAVVKILEGSTSTSPKLLLIDYLRSVKGKKGTERNAFLSAMQPTEAGHEAAFEIEASGSSPETSLILSEMLGMLPERERLIVIWNVVEGWTNKEIGEKLDLTEARVCQLLKLALGKLRSRMEKD